MIRHLETLQCTFTSSRALRTLQIQDRPLRHFMNLQTFQYLFSWRSFTSRCCVPRTNRSPLAPLQYANERKKIKPKTQPGNWTTCPPPVYTCRYFNLARERTHDSWQLALCSLSLRNSLRRFVKNWTYNLLTRTPELNALAKAPVQYSYTKISSHQVNAERATRRKIVVCVCVRNYYHRHIT